MRKVHAGATSGNSGALTRQVNATMGRDSWQFSSLARAVQNRYHKKFRRTNEESTCGSTLVSSSALTRQFRKFDRGTRLQAVQLH
jgi:hypothetical protein